MISQQQHKIPGPNSWRRIDSCFAQTTVFKKKKNGREGKASKIFQWNSITLVTKLDKDITKNEIKDNVSDEHRCKLPEKKKNKNNFSNTLKCPHTDKVEL